nr:hypothetical protein [Tanacetum cinerariifolium]
MEALEVSPPRTFNETMGTPIDLLTFFMNRLKIDNLTQEILVGSAFNLLKGTCKSFAELEFHFEECYKLYNDRLDWYNLKGIIVVTRVKVMRWYDYGNLEEIVVRRDDNILYKFKEGEFVRHNLRDIEDILLLLVQKKLSNLDVDNRIIVVTRVKVMRWYDYGNLEEIVVRRDDNILYKFKEGEFVRHNLRDIEDILLLLVQKKLSNLDVDNRYGLGVPIRMFTRRIIIVHRVEDL